MARDYAKKLIKMRAYAKTPAGLASKKASQERWLAKRKADSHNPRDKLKTNPLPLLNAMANWRQL